MPMVFDPHYYSLDVIPDYRLEYIELRSNWFMDLLGISEICRPLDCAAFLKKLKASDKMRFTYGFVNLSSKFDALAQYIHEHDVYLMQINANKVTYPFTVSKTRRINFTLAHELGHIALEHLSISKSLKSRHQQEIEELEADEFAGRLLMPETELLNCNYTSVDAVAEHFLVSKQALWKRLNNLKRLDLLSSAPDKNRT